MIEGQRQKAGANRRRRRKPKPEVKAKVDPILIVARRPDSPLMLKVSNRNIAASGRPKRRAGVFHAAPDAVEQEERSDTQAAVPQRDSVELAIAGENNRGEPGSSDAKFTDVAGSRAEQGAVTEQLSAPVRVRRVASVASIVEPVRAESRERGRRGARSDSNGLLDDMEHKRQRLIERLVTSEGRGAISKLANELEHHNWSPPEEQAVQIQLLEHVDERRACAAIDVMSRLLATQTPIKRPILDQRLRRLEEGAEEIETRQKAAALRRTLRVA